MTCSQLTVVRTPSVYYIDCLVQFIWSERFTRALIAVFEGTSHRTSYCSLTCHSIHDSYKYNTIHIMHATYTVTTYIRSLEYVMLSSRRVFTPRYFSDSHIIIDVIIIRIFWAYIKFHSCRHRTHNTLCVHNVCIMWTSIQRRHRTQSPTQGLQREVGWLMGGREVYNIIRPKTAS